MFYYIPQIILFLSLLFIVWIVIKNLPKIKEVAEVEEDIFQRNKVNRVSAFLGEKVFKKMPIEEVDARFNGLIEKTLRRLRIVLIKFDAKLQKTLNIVKEGAKPKNIFRPEEVIFSNLETEKKDVIDLEGILPKGKEENIQEIKRDVVDQYDNIDMNETNIKAVTAEPIVEIAPIAKKERRSRKKEKIAKIESVSVGDNSEGKVTLASGNKIPTKRRKNKKVDSSDNDDMTITSAMPE